MNEHERRSSIRETEARVTAHRVSYGAYFKPVPGRLPRLSGRLDAENNREI